MITKKNKYTKPAPAISTEYINWTFKKLRADIWVEQISCCLLCRQHRKMAYLLHICLVFFPPLLDISTAPPWHYSSLIHDSVNNDKMWQMLRVNHNLCNLTGENSIFYVKRKKYGFFFLKLHQVPLVLNSISGVIMFFLLWLITQTGRRTSKRWVILIA